MHLHLLFTLAYPGPVPGWVRARLQRTENPINVPLPEHPVCQTFWHGNPGTDCVKSAKQLKAVLAIPETSPLPNPHYHDAALVFTTATRRGVHAALTTIALLRQNASFYAEIHTSGPALSFCSRVGRGVTCVALTIQATRFANKPLAILKSYARHVIFFDTDVVPIINPFDLLKTFEYERHGTIFWPDLWGLGCKSIEWGNRRALCGQTAWPEHILHYVLDVNYTFTRGDTLEMDSGIMIIDTERHWGPLALALRLANDSFVQSVAYGDKDCFRLAWLAYGQEFFYGASPSELGRPPRRTQLLHYWHGSPAFIHQYKFVDANAGSLNLEHRVPPPCYDGCFTSDRAAPASVGAALLRWNALNRNV